MNTVKVKPWGKDQGEFVIINEEDFDPIFHEQLDAPGETERPRSRRKGVADEAQPADQG